MKTLRCGVLVLLCSAALPWTAHAADILLDGEAPCLSIGGAWTSGTCTVDRLVVPAGTRLIAGEAVTLSTGDLLINGALEIWGGFEATRSVENRGTLKNYSDIVITVPMINRGSWDAYAGVWANNTVVNEWDFMNRAGFSSETFVNRGYMTNFYSGFIENGDRFINEGYLANHGSIDNYEGSILDNFGVITNDVDAMISNSGTALGRCGSAWSIPDYFPYIVFWGNPIEFEPCQPTEAVAALGRSVVAFGERGMLSKHDTKVLTLLLSKAFKRLEAGREAEAVALLQTFKTNVPNSFATASLIYRSDRIVRLITNP